MPITVIFDANILIQSPRQVSDEWRSLTDRAHEWNLSFVVPEVAFMETVRRLRYNWKQQIDQLKGQRVAEFGLEDDKRRMIETIQARCDSLEDDLRASLTAIRAKIIAPSGDLLKLAERAANGRAPFRPLSDKKAKEGGVCDALIWNTVLAVARNRRDHEVWFVSENHGDFGLRGENNWTGPNAGTIDDCPIAFHEHLVEDLAEIGAVDRVRYARTIKSLEQRLAAQSAPLDDEELREEIDFDVLAKEFGAAATNHLADAREVGLAPWSTMAVASAVPDVETWQFHDGARRGDSGWTARFVVTAATRIAVSGQSGRIEFVDKPLVYAGDLVAADANGAFTVTVTSAAALPDDPDRVLWMDSDDSEAADATSSLAAALVDLAAASGTGRRPHELTRHFLKHYLATITSPGPSLVEMYEVMDKIRPENSSSGDSPVDNPQPEKPSSNEGANRPDEQGAEDD